MKYLCSDCFEDSYLRAKVEECGEEGSCDECGEDKPLVISFSELGEILEPILREHFKLGETLPHFYADEDEPSYEQEGSDLSDIVQEVLGQYFICNDEIITAVIDAEDCWPPDGDIPFWDRGCTYVEKPLSEYSEYRQRWFHVEQDLDRRQRFFNPSAKDFFEDVFQDVDGVKVSSSGAKKDRKIVAILPESTLIYRSRVCSSRENINNALKDPLKHVGPPPSDKARAGRIDPEGVPVLYGAKDLDTSLSELRMSISEEAAVIQLETTKPVRMLDFTRIGSAYVKLSYFQSDFTEQVARSQFIRSLGQLISRPIIPGHENEYLATQVMMEYLAHIHGEPFEGVIFASSQKTGGENVVLFSDAEGRFPVTYKDESIAFYKATEVTYRHSKLDYWTSNDEVYLSGIEDD